MTLTPDMKMRIWVQFNEANEPANCIGMVNVDGYFKRREAWEAHVVLMKNTYSANEDVFEARLKEQYANTNPTK